MSTYILIRIYLFIVMPCIFFLQSQSRPLIIVLDSESLAEMRHKIWMTYANANLCPWFFARREHEKAKCDVLRKTKGTELATKEILE